MNKIKIIELLNMISRGEEVPQKIKVGNKIYNYETFNIGKGDNYFTAEWREVKGYRISCDGTYYYLEIRDYNLSDEVEIIEDKQEPKPITKKDLEALGYAFGEMRKALQNGWNKSSNNEPFKEDKKIEKFKDYIPIGLTSVGADFRKKDVFEALLKIGDKINEIIDVINRGD